MTSSSPSTRRPPARPGGLAGRLHAGGLAAPRRPRPPAASGHGAAAAAEESGRRFALAMTAGGTLALVDPQTGGVLAEAPLAGRALDLAWDPFHARAFAFVLDEEEQSGTLMASSIGLDPPALGPPEARSWLDGVAHVLPTPFGPVVFEESYGTRWRLLAESGKPTASRPAPLPASAWSLDAGDAGDAADPEAEPFFGLRGVGVTAEGVPSRWTAEASSAGLSSPVQGSLPLDVPPGEAPLRGARATGCDWIARIEGGLLAVRCVDEAGQPTFSAELALAPGSHLEAAAPLASGDALALLLGPEARLLVARREGSSLVHALVSLGAEVSGDAPFSRLLAPAGPSRLLAATNERVVAVDVTLSPGSISAAIDTAFDGSALRAPLDAFRVPPH